MEYGYCRISTAKQSIVRQIRNIKAAYPNAVIVQEIFTRTRIDRKEWQKLFSKAASCTVLYFIVPSFLMIIARQKHYTLWGVPHSGTLTPSLPPTEQHTLD